MAALAHRKSRVCGLLSCAFTAAVSCGSALAQAPAGKATTPGGAEVKSPTRVSVVGLHVCGVDEAEEYKDWHITGFDASPSTKLLVRINSDTYKFVELNHDGSQVTAIEDDKGKDLKPKDLSRQFFFSQIAANRKSVLVLLEASQAPSPGATAVLARASLKLTVAPKSEQVKTPVVAVKKGTKVTAGKLTLTISDVGKSMSGKPSITFSHNTSSAAIARIAVIGPGGKEIKTSEDGRGRLTTPFGSTWTHEIVLDQPVEEASFVIDSWVDVKEITVPVDVRCVVRLSAE